MTRMGYSELTRATRMRMVTASLLRSAASVTVLVVLYYTAPLEQRLDSGWIGFGFGLLVFAGVIGWQVRAIARSDFPRLQAIQAVSTGLPLIGLIALGLVVRLLLGAVQEAVQRHEAEEPEQPDAIRHGGA
jgi:voltage-gated potassium channel